MNIETIKETVRKIESIKEDHEAAHGLEDDLYHRFLLHVSMYGNDYLGKMADEILKTKNIDFPRYCA